MRYLLPLVVLVALACQNDLTLPTEGTPNTPALAPAGTTAAYTTLDCRNAINVGPVVLVETTPALQSVTTPGPATIFGAVYRDDTSWPGVQIHCRDYVQTISWPNTLWMIETYTPQSVTVLLDPFFTGGTQRIIGTVGTKADTSTVIFVKRQ